MSSHDELDDVLSEIKKKKTTAGGSPRRAEEVFEEAEEEMDSPEIRRSGRLETTRPAIEEKAAAVAVAMPEGWGWGEEEATDRDLSTPPDQRKTERLSRQLAQQALPSSPGTRAAQEQQWDALWQSVAVKKKKPELYDYEAEELDYPPKSRQPSAPSRPVRRPLGEEEELFPERASAPARRGISSQTPPTYQDVAEELPDRPAPPVEQEVTGAHRTRQFHLSIPELDEAPPPQSRRAPVPEPVEEEQEEEFLLGVNDPPAVQRAGKRQSPVPSAKGRTEEIMTPSMPKPRKDLAEEPLEQPEPNASRRRSLFGDMNKSIFETMEDEDGTEESRGGEPAAPTIDPEEEMQLHSRRKSKVNAFFAKKEFDVDEEEENGQEDISQESTSQENSRDPRPRAHMGRMGRLKDNFGREDNEEEMREQIEQTRSNTLIRMGVTAVLFGLLFYLHLGKVHMLMMPGFLWPEMHPLTYIAVTFGLLLTAALVNANIVGGGLISLFTLKPDNDSLTALSVVASVVQCAVLTIMPEYVMDTQNVHLYCFIPALALMLSNVGRFMYINRVDRGSRIVLGSSDKYAILKVENEDLARELTRGLDIEEPSVAVSVKTERLAEYTETAYANDFSENISRILAPICLAASIIVSLAGYFLSDPKSAFGALTSFAALTAVCSPLTASIAASMPLGRMSKQLHREGAMLASYQAADEFSDVSAVVLDATDLFSTKDVTLFTVKPFAEKRIDDALLDAASLICSTRSTLTGIFSNIIQGQKNLLRPVENIVYEDGMGLTAWVNKKRVLIGNRALMQHYGVDTPSKDFEAKYCRDHRDILYLSNSGELSAMFVLGYSVNEDAAEMLGDLMDQNITISVSVNDPNVTAEKICRLYEFPMEDIRIIPAQTQEALQLYCRPREKARAEAAHIGSTASMVHAVCAAYSAKTAVVLATMIQFIGVFLGYAVLTFFVFTGSFASITPDLLAVYLAIWAVLVVVIPRLRKI